MSILEIVFNIAIYLINSLGYVGIFLGMAIESACIPLPSEVIMCFAGFIVEEGKFQFWPVVIIGTLGNLVGSLVAYYVGAKGGRPLIDKYGSYIHLNPKRVDQVDAIFRKHGAITVCVCRILPIVRTFISLPAGISKMDVKKFSLYTVIGSFPWSLFLTYIGVVLGDNWEIVRKYFHYADIIVAVAIVLIIIYWIYKSKFAKD